MLHREKAKYYIGGVKKMKNKITVLPVLEPLTETEQEKEKDFLFWLQLEMQCVG